MKSLYQNNKLEILKSILNGNLSLIDNFDKNQVTYLNEEITIKPSYVRKMLERYLKNEISYFDLNNWARFICLRTEYTVPDWENAEVNDDFYSDMYYVIQRISTPEIDGDIDEERIKGYLAELNAKYPTDPPERLCK